MSHGALNWGSKEAFPCWYHEKGVRCDAEEHCSGERGFRPRAQLHGYLRPTGQVRGVRRSFLEGLTPAEDGDNHPEDEVSGGTQVERLSKMG